MKVTALIPDELINDVKYFAGGGKPSLKAW